MSKASDDRLKEIRDRKAMAAREWDEIYAEAKKDRLCVAGDPWAALDPQGKKQRLDPAVMRPCLASDELNQYLNQWINGIRANPRAIQFDPTGNGANDAGATFYQNHTREIEYRSHAQMAYCTAGADMATSSIGWLRLTAKREHLRTFNQELWIEPIVNPDQVLVDPNSVWPDSRDAKFLFYTEPWTLNEFNRRFPKAQHKSFSSELRNLADGWFSRNSGLQRDLIQVAEYWTLVLITRRLVAYQVPGEEAVRTALLEELPDGKLPAGTENVREEDVDDEQVEACLTNGVEILEEIPWLGKHIPFVSCMGKQIYVDGGGGSRRRLLSLTRLARDPYMLYCYVITCEAEAMGSVPRAQYVGYKGQFAKPEVWAKANRVPVPFVEVWPTVDGAPANEVLPLPQRQPWDPPLQNLELVKESTRRAIQAAFGTTPNPAPDVPHDQLSGRAKDKFDSSAQRGSFHLNDNFDLMIERTGIILENLIEEYLDTPRDVPVREAVQGKGAIVRVNDPKGSVLAKDGQLSGDPIFTKGDYRCTVTSGPDTESQRIEGDHFVDAMVANLQEIAAIAGPQKALKLLAKSVSLKPGLGPIGKEIVELLDPPPPNGPNGKPLSPDAQALMGEVQQLQQQLQQAAQEKQGKVVEQQGKLAIVQVQESAESQRAALDREVRIAVAEITAQAKQSLQDMALFYEERARIGAQIHEQALGGKEAAHNLHLAREAAAHDSIENAKDRLHEHVQAVVGHEQALEAADQAATIAANQPADTGGGV